MKNLSVIALLAAFSSTVPIAATAQAAGAIDQLREFVAHTSSATGDFVQSDQSARAGSSTSGKFAFARPGRFRWEVVKPYEQLLVADGKEVFFHDVDLNQVTVRPMSGALGATPAAILFGTGGDLSEQFVMSEEGPKGKAQWLSAVPRQKEAGFETIRIGFADNLPQSMEVLDAFGRTSVFEFRNMTRNPALVDSQFEFSIPAGADVVRP